MAYCRWQAGHSPEPFLGLLELVPDLDGQILAQVQRCCPSLAWEAWTQHVQRAAADPEYGQELAEQFVQASSSLAGAGSSTATRRALSF